MLTVFKIGGGKEINLDAFLEDFAEYDGAKILVHGGNHELTDLQTKMGHPPRMLTSKSGQASRFTDRQTMEYFWMVYCGRVNKYIVERLQRLGVNAIGLSGLDGRLAVGKRRSRIRMVEDGRTRVLDGDFSGSIEQINIELLQTLLGLGYVPVVTPPALSTEGEAINVDGDKLAAQIAVQMEADKLLYFIAAPGLLSDLNEGKSLIHSVKLAQIEETMSYAGGRMKKKLLAAKWALEGGVGDVRVGDGRVGTPIQRLLDGGGTVFCW